MKALVGAFNQEKALVGAFSVIVLPVVEPMEHCTALTFICSMGWVYTQWAAVITQCSLTSAPPQLMRFVPNSPCFTSAAPQG